MARTSARWKSIRFHRSMVPFSVALEIREKTRQRRTIFYTTNPQGGKKPSRPLYTSIRVQHRTFINPTMIQMLLRLWPIIQPIVQPILVASATALVSLIASWNPEKSEQLAKRFLSTEEGAAGGAGSRVKFPILSIFVVTLIISGLYVTRFQNPAVRIIIGAEKTELGLAKKKAALPFAARFDTKTALESMNASLTAMELHLGAAISHSTNLVETQTKVNEIRTQGYTNGINVVLGRAEELARDGAVREVEKVLLQVDNYSRKGGVMDSQVLLEVKQVAYSIAAEKLMATAEAEANAGNISSVSSALSTVSEYIRMVDGLSVTEKDIEHTLRNAKENFLSTIIHDARLESSKGSRVQTRNLIKKARRYAKGEGLSIDEAELNEILNSCQ